MTARRTAPVPLLVLLLAAGACSDDPQPDEIRISPSSLSFDAVGLTATLSARVFDDEGNEMTGRTVEWSTGAPGVATVTATGVVTSVGAGNGSILATSGRASASLPVSVVPQVTELRATSETSLSGNAGEPLPQQVGIEALDRLGNPAEGVSVEAIVDAGGGSVSATLLTTDAAGRASVTWTLGPVAGTVQQMRIRSTERPNLATFFLADAVPGPVAELVVQSGDGQAGLPGTDLLIPVRVRAQDRFANARAGQAVSFQVASGGGSVDAVEALTDADGEAEARWTLGSEPGAQTLQVSVGDLGVEVGATAVTEPAALVVVQGATVTGTVGEPVSEPLSVRVQDTNGTGVPGVPVRFSVGPAGGTLRTSPDGPDLSEALFVTDAQGEAAPTVWILGAAAGGQELEASFPGLDPVLFAADALPGAPRGLAIEAGGFQTGAIGQPLADPVRIRVEDRFGNAVPGGAVEAAVTAGGGSVAGATVVADASGVAEVLWTLGSVVGLQSLAVGGAGIDPLLVHAAGLRPTNGLFTVELAISVDGDPEIWAAFQVSANRWSRVIVDDVPDVLADVAPGQCGEGSPAVQGIVDDVRILVFVQSIDGPGGTLGSAGPCWIRDDTSLPFLGRMRLDVEDLQRMLDRGTLVDVITHEIGHILGVGTLWNRLGFLQDPSLVTPGADTHFNGPAAIAAFDGAGGTTYTGAKVPVENVQGEQGTRDVHWRESVMTIELMTGFINNTFNPLSVVTAASMEDLGYTVDLTAADGYSLSPALLQGPLPAQIPLLNDVLVLPLRTASPLPPGN
ncbi:MAG: leishmanolysin-related zinc metalloendopeptidase [Longimicrobiales bacterium]|nr:leishmanolysin-related zinc metalloendopeptidase [Longimicrobiales bacterium]